MALFEFDSNTRDFSRSNAYWLGRVSKLTYSDRDTVAAEVADWGLNADQAFFECRDTQAFVAGNDDMLVLAFRGTEPREIHDWLTDFDAAQVAGPGGKVHEGFAVALNYVWADIWQFIRTRRKQRALWVAGHSLGGALATLAVAKLRLEKDEPVNGLYTFGQPRTGDRDFADRFDADFGDQAFRYVNNADMVPRVPTRAMGFSHVGTFCYFDRDGRENNAMSWWDQVMDRMGGTLADILDSEKWREGMFHHPMDKYLECLDRARQS